MPKRFTDSEKWKDPWFHKLPTASKLFFLYLCDQCDIAGFWEVDIGRASFDTGHSAKALVSALKHLESRYETNGKYLWIRRFIEFQGNYPFKDKVRVHIGIKRLLKEREGFSDNITRLLNGEGLPNSYETLSKGLFNPTSNSNSLSNSKGNSQGHKASSYTKDFETFWAAYTTAGNTNGKLAAYSNWQTCLNGRRGKKAHNPVAVAELLTAAEHYAEHCRAKGTEPQFVMLAKTFLGPNRPWADYVEAHVDPDAAYANEIIEEAKRDGN